MLEGLVLHRLAEVAVCILPAAEKTRAPKDNTKWLTIRQRPIQQSQRHRLLRHSHRDLAYFLWSPALEDRILILPTSEHQRRLGPEVSRG